MPNRDNEKRQYKRYIVDGIQGNILHPLDIKVLNISINGAGIESTQRIDVNKEYTFKITYKDAILNLRGRVVWALLSYREKKDSKEIIPLYMAGVVFIDTLTEKAKTLLSFIDLNKKTLELRLGGVRFEIDDPDKVKIYFPYKYEVKQISLSGMLIETEHHLDLNSHYDMELYLNTNILNMVGRVVHCEKLDSPDVTKYGIGIEFIGIEFIRISDNDLKILEDFLASL